jgi:stage II sporulation protein AA (anti-sigma F factor antagonist)
MMRLERYAAVVAMEMQIEELDADIIRARLIGRMDYAGATEIDAKFMELAAREKMVLVDLSKVDFLASMGIRTLIMAAKVVKARGDRMVLFSPEMMVAKVLQTSGTDILIPVYYDLALACKALQAARAPKS